MIERKLLTGESYTISNQEKEPLSIVAFTREEYQNKISFFEKRFIKFIEWKEKAFSEVHVDKDKIKRYRVKPIYGDVFNDNSEFLLTEKQIWFIFKADMNLIIEKTNKVDVFLNIKKK